MFKTCLIIPIKLGAKAPKPGQQRCLGFHQRYRFNRSTKENNGDTHRTHMVIDCVVNPWMKKLFTEAGHTEPKTDFKYVDPSINDNNVEHIIAALESQNTPTSLELAKDLRKRSLAV